MSYPTPHGDKLRALLGNDKLPKGDRPRVRTAIGRYEAWVAEIEGIDSASDGLVESLVASLNRYKSSLELDLIFDSKDDFLYRQKGQLKLDNSVLEEFLPWLVGRVFADRLAELGLTPGPANAFSQIRFDAGLPSAPAGGGMVLRSKDHDFALSRPLFLKASNREDFNEAREEKTYLAHLAVEIKTNLDKTMFQEANATAYDLKLAVPNARYFLLCEWLDMAPISTAATAIEEVIVLRKTRRLAASARERLSTAAGRAAARDVFERRLSEHPLAPEAFRRLLFHIGRLLGGDAANEQDALARGWF